jgi:hypothetical protein
LVALNEHLGITVERLSLLGGLAKRKVLVMRSHRDKERALIEMRDAYHEALKLSTKDNKQVNSYHLLNFVTADLLLNLRGRKGLTKQEIDNLVRQAAPAAEARNLLNPNFWDAVASVDYILVQYLTHGGLAGDITGLADQYIAAKKAARIPQRIPFDIRSVRFLGCSGNARKGSSREQTIEEGLAELRLKLNQ